MGAPKRMRRAPAASISNVFFLVAEYLDAPALRAARLVSREFCEYADAYVEQRTAMRRASLADACPPDTPSICLFAQRTISRTRVRIVLENPIAWQCITHLNLSVMGIKKIPPGFKLASLRELDLSGNKLVTVEADTFCEMPELRNLNLRNNQLMMIEAGAFRDMSSLYNLNLSRNQLTVIQAGTFCKLRSLYYLILSENTLTTIEAGAFGEMPALQEISTSTSSAAVLTRALGEGFATRLYILPDA